MHLDTSCAGPRVAMHAARHACVGVHADGPAPTARAHVVACMHEPCALATEQQEEVVAVRGERARGREGWKEGKEEEEDVTTAGNMHAGSGAARFGGGASWRACRSAGARAGHAVRHALALALLALIMGAIELRTRVWGRVVFLWTTREYCTTKSFLLNSCGIRFGPRLRYCLHYVGGAWRGA